jgi:hypothetical protein
MKAIFRKLKSIKKIGIPNCAFHVNENLDIILKNYETCKSESDRNRLRTADYKNLEAALFAWFKPAKLQNASVSGPLLMKKAGVFAGQMGLELSANPGLLDLFKERDGIVFKNICERYRRIFLSLHAR